LPENGFTVAVGHTTISGIAFGLRQLVFSAPELVKHDLVHRFLESTETESETRLSRGVLTLVVKAQESDSFPDEGDKPETLAEDSRLHHRVIASDRRA
jgi:hypothetical protein